MKKNLVEVAALYESGMPIEQIEEILGISKRKVKRYLSNLAFTLPYTYLKSDSKRSLKKGTH